MNHLPLRFYAPEAVNHCENDARDGITIPTSCFFCEFSIFSENNKVCYLSC